MATLVLRNLDIALDGRGGAAKELKRIFSCVKDEYDVLILDCPPNITGSELVTNLALEGLDKLLGACFGIEPDPFKAAELIDKRIREKRKALGLGE